MRREIDVTAVVRVLHLLHVVSDSVADIWYFKHTMLNQLRNFAAQPTQMYMSPTQYDTLRGAFLTGAKEKGRSKSSRKGRRRG